MLFQFNYQFLSQQLFGTTTTAAAKTNTASQKLESPEVNGPVDHVAFVIHGIGQQTEKFGFFQSHLQSLFDTTNSVVQENRPDQQVNVQYIPIEWHKHIHQETDNAMDDITLNSIPSMRMLNNDYLSDAFFYFSKERGQSIVDHVTATFNTSYAEFMEANPNFAGKIVILAYSLGGVITWDILSNQPRADITKQETQLYSKLDFEFPALNFKPDYLFNLGSPLSAFLTVRNQDPKLYHPDPSILFENIFHPFDPLAYRFEPMLELHYKHTTAVFVDDSRAANSQQEEPHSFFSGGVISSLKRYFTTATSVITYPFSSAAQQQEQDACMQERDASTQVSAISTPNLSIDCSPDCGEHDDDYDGYSTPLATPINLLEADPFMYAAADDALIDTFTTQESSSFLVQENQEPTVPEKKRKRSYSEDYFVLNTTVSKSSKTEATASFDLGPKISHRIDYVLKPERFMGMIPKNEYISGLTAHFSYWTNRDLMWHIVRRLEQQT